MAYKPIISVDFDGVIHSYSSGWKGAGNIPDDPVPGAIQALLGYLDAGFTVAIFSSRSKSLFGRWAMKRWMRKHLAEYWTEGSASLSFAEAECWGDAAAVVNRFSWPWFKPSAVLTIDDRAVCFDGKFPDVETVRRFQPWNKRKRPTVAELEEILRSDDSAHVEILPDGSIRSPYGAGPSS